MNEENFSLEKNKPLTESWERQGGEKPTTTTPRPTAPSASSFHLDYRELLNNEILYNATNDLKNFGSTTQENTEYLLKLVTQLCIVIQAKDMKINELLKK